MALELPLPYQKDITDFRLPGKVHAVGQVNAGAKRFEVNLLSQDGEHLLHFNPRFDEGCVVRSSTNEGQWQAEERDGGLPFVPGQQFTLDLSVEEGRVVCTVNGSQFCEFAARDDFSKLGAVSVAGDIQLHSLEVSTTGGPGVVHESSGNKGPREVDQQEQPSIIQPTHPEPQPIPAEPTPHQPQPPPAQGPQGTLSVPYQAPLQALLQTNRMRVVGVPHQGAKRFTVNFKTHDGQTLFHFNPRFDQNCVVRNASVNKQYSPEGEERDGAGCPFRPGVPFALDFLVHGNIIRCFVDGLEFCQFQMRGNLNEVAILDIHGDLALNQVLIA
ncbi:Lectin, galactoside-binding, soluble [Globodera pallida]|nr:Lectin, galactoside-binding, soluble [Globodera pallida]